MNSQINGPRCITKSSFRVRAVERFLQQTQMCSIGLNVQPICEGPKYIFFPYTSNENITLIDHIIAENSLTDLYTRCSILKENELNTSDHLPVIAHVNLQPISYKKPDFVRIKYNWDKLSQKEISDTYGAEIDTVLQELQLPDSNKSSDVDTFYITIISKLQSASMKTLPKQRYKKHLKPKWSTEVAPFHASMRAARLVWIRRGRPRNNDDESYINYKNATRIFRNKLRNVFAQIELDLYNDIDTAASVDYLKRERIKHFRSFTGHCTRKSTAN